MESFINSHDYPLVSVGMPVYNEARFIEDSLKSIIAQDYPNLEIIISNNASTDETMSICKRVVREFTNVIIHEFEHNMGATENGRYVLQVAKGKYFMWVSGHDLWATNLVSECVALLESIPSAVIAFGTPHWIDENGNRMTKFLGYSDTRGLNPISRFFTVFWGNMAPILGVIRKSALDQSHPIPSTLGSDLILLSTLVLKGDFVHARRTHWQRREFRHESSHAEQLKRYRSSGFGLTNSFIDTYFPLVRLPFELSRTVINSDLKIFEKIAVLLNLAASLPVRFLVGKQ